MPGETSVQAVARFFNTRIEPLELRDRDELVVFSFGTNDVITGVPAEQSRAALEAALNLADECLRLRHDVEEARRESRAAGSTVDDGIARLARKLGSALGE